MNAAALLLIGLVDAAFAGFRAHAGRDGRIRRRAAALRGASRGFVAGVAVMTVAAVCAGTVLGAADDAGAAYRTLDVAAGHVLLVLVPYAAVVAACLLCYGYGPFRLSTLAVLAGLGPLTMLRPVAVVGCVLVAARTSPAAALVTAAAGAGVLLVEPWVHRRWYQVPW